MTTWKSHTRQLVLDYCNEHSIRTFTLQEFQLAKATQIENFKEGNNHPYDKVRQQLQFLREDGFLSFKDNRGTYTLKELITLKNEIAEEATPFIHTLEKNKREYLIEVHSRDRGLIQQAKAQYGCYCLHPKCSNTFNKDDGSSYIEIHHIIPLFKDGEDALWNLIPVCAHHHKMAHFSDTKTRLSLETKYLNIVETLVPV